MFFICGCVNYKYLYGVKSYGDGYVVSRNNTVIAEYTIGIDNKAPQDLDLAKERFQRRRGKVEYYYREMDIFYRPLSSFLSYPRAIFGAFCGVFKLPFIIVSDYRYEHNPKYRKIIDDRDAAEIKKERDKRESLEDEFSAFIKRDLNIEEELNVKSNK